MIMFFAFLMLLPSAFATFSELTFELPDKEVQCFFEEIEKDAEYTLVFQVVAGGHYDVDCFIEDPIRQMVYRKHKIRYDTFVGKAEIPGVYRFCFGNQFSTFTHKKIYFHFQAGEELQILPNVEDKASALTQLESSCASIHYAMKTVVSLQSHQRVRAMIDRLHIVAVSTHVIYWAASESIMLFLVTVGQVIILKRFFTEKKASVSAVST